ncbi:GNAT family N-acetyltransferase [uncultured Methanocorpusculum sp.]|nr:GNAT family N-acetyltransferase [uncultured Methanocorpusculum sp.]
MRSLQIDLRLWEERDAPSLAFFANEPLIAKNLRAGFPSPYNLEDAKAYIAFCHQLDPAENLCLAITNDDCAVGCIGVFCRGERRAELGYWLGKPYWGKGIMTKMITEICGTAFQIFPIDEIFAEPNEWNAASQRVLEKSGFVYTGEKEKSRVYTLGRGHG